MFLLFLLRFFFVVGILNEFVESQNSTNFSKGQDRSAMEKRLRERLLETYEKSMIPNGNSSQVFVLRMEMILTGIQEVDVRNQRMHVSAWLKMEWYDPRLSWTASANGNLTSLAFNQEDIYLPEIMLFNRYRARNTELFGETMAVAYWHGEVIWLPAASLEVPCAMDLSTWPFDTHECTFIFGHASRDNSTFEVYPDATTVNVDSFVSAVVDWQVVSSNTQRFQYYFNAGDGYDNVRFNITVRRNILPFFRSLFFAPRIILLTSLLIFWISDVNFRVLFAVAEITISVVFGACLWNIIPPAHSPPKIAYLVTGIPILILVTLSMSVLLDILSACSYRYPSCLKGCVGLWNRRSPSSSSSSQLRSSSSSPFSSSSPAFSSSSPLRSGDVVEIANENLVSGNDNDRNSAEKKRQNEDWIFLANFLRIFLSVLYSIACGLLTLLTAEL